MNRRLYIIALILLVSGFATASGADAEADVGGQLWWTVKLRKKLSEQYSLRVQGATRWDQDLSSSFHHHFQLGLLYHDLWGWVPGANYRIAFKQTTDVDGLILWQGEHQPIFDLTRRWKRWRWELTLRNRFQYKSLNEELIYRLFLDLETPTWCCCGTRLALFASQEGFWEVGETFRENRSIVGIVLPRTDDVSARIGLMLRVRDRGAGESSLEHALRVDWLAPLSKR